MPSTRPEPAISPAARLWLLGERAIGALKILQSSALLAARLHVASIFFRSGLTKLRDWDTTLALFTNEYHVPLLSPELAAVLGTGGELVLPVLLVLGLFGRFAAAGLTVVNVMAVISLTDIPGPALLGHVFWGSLLLAALMWGPGAISVDRFLVPALRRRVFGQQRPASEPAVPRISRVA